MYICECFVFICMCTHTCMWKNSYYIVSKELSIYMGTMCTCRLEDGKEFWESDSRLLQDQEVL